MAMPVMNESRSRMYNPFVYKKAKIVCSRKNLPEFKPGNTPYLQYGNEMLNANVKWNELIQDILDHGYSIEQMANCAGTSQTIVENALQQVYQGLTFRVGAKILALHGQCHPNQTC